MSSPRELINLENKFWQSLVDQDADTATQLLCEPALMVSSHGAMKFDHAAYRKMAAQGPMVLTAFELDDMDVVFPNDATAILTYKVRQTMSSRAQKDESRVQHMNETSTWLQTAAGWRCIMHTETPAAVTPA